ncbi:hypothetical protein HHI36_015863 [Cryptolaemus montrouzieri]|uniref:Uncharacterized protein n=1 Tax=Cryptolaemus montrouzieri TaxID=559131 RepID=A0ABD2N797_9CUCU
MGDSDLFSGFRYWFYHLGLWSPKPTRIYRIYNYLVLTTFSFFILGFALVISDAARIGLEVFGVNFGVLLTMTITMLKMVNSSRQKYQTILNHVFQQHEYICSKNDFKYIFLKPQRYPRGYFNSYCFEDYCPRPFPFIYWTPFDQRKYYMMANFYQDFHAAIVAILIIYTDFVVLAPVFFLIAKIKVLQYVLEHPTEFFKKELTYEENFYYVARECVVEYQDIIK